MSYDAKRGDEPAETPVRFSNSQAFLVFLGGLILLFGFFAVGAYVGRWSKPQAPTAQSAQQTGKSQKAATEYFLVEVEIADSRDRADATLAQLRRQYTSATAELDPADGRYHVYVGPYDATAAETVASELADQGRSSVAIKPYRSSNQ